jgi:hypothetical protein
MTLGGASPAWADELTLYNNENTSQYLPVNGYYADTKGNISEFVIPASSLSSMAGGTISSIKFYSAKESQTWGSAQYKVYVKEVINTSLTAYVGYSTSTVVYEGALSISSNEMTITFSTPFAYGDGNLLIGTYLSTAGTCSGSNEVQFYGKSDAGTNVSRYKTSSEYASNFLPKITLTYVPNGSFVSKPQNVSAGSITATGATISWDAVDGADSYELSCSTSSTEPAEEGSYTSVNTNSYNLTGLTGYTLYYVYVRTIKGGDKSKWSAVCSFTPGTLTVNNVSTTTNNYVPIYGNYMDDHSRSQFILPKASLSSLSGTQITKIIFYGTANNTAKFANKTFDVYMKEVDDASISSLSDWASLEQVYSGNLTISDGKMTITLDDGFDYSGDKNLLIGINQTDDDKDYTETTWTGVSATGSSIGGYGSSISQRNFLPQITFYFAPQTATVKKPKNLAASATATTTATLGWTDGEDGLTEWQIAYSTDTDFNPDSEGTKVAANANPFTLTELTAATTYYAYVRAKKGEDYSGWSNKAEFPTLSALPIIELSTTSHNFGLVSDADAQALTLTISNTGGAALTGLTVIPTSGFAVTDMEGNALTATAIAASSTLSVKVKMSALGQQNGTITIDGNEIDEQVVNVSGYMLDDSKITETFANASSVSRWTVASGWTFNASTGAYSGASERTMTTPKISVGAGNVLALNVKLGWNGGSLKVEGSTDNGTTWEAFEAKVYNSSNGGLNTSSYVLLTINDIPTTVNKIRLTGYYAYINVFNGFTYVNDPQVGFFSNEACTSVQASPATKNFGFATEAQNQTYYVKNTGNGQVDLTIDAPSGFTATVNDGGEALTENEVATLTITMPATEGLHDGTITVTAKNHDDDSVLGTFVVNANGGITGAKNNVVLTSFPAGWQNNNWAINSGAARIWSSTPSDLITTTLRVAAGDKLLVDAKKYDNSDDSQLSYSYSANNGTSWSDPVSLTSSLGTDYKIVAVSGIPEGDVLMKFTGTYAYIRQIYGFEAVAEPIMEFTADGTTKNFGMITAKATSDAYTITNSGTALLDNLSVTCNNANFEIAVADNATSIAAGSNVTFTVALKTTALGSQSGTVTISGTGVESKTLNVKGYVADDSKIFTTFTALPDRWTNASNYWTFSANGASATSSSSKLETPKIIVAEGQKLAISAKLQYSGSYFVTINGSSDNGATWTAYTKTLNNAQLNNTDYTVVELDDVPTTVNKLQLVGYYVYVNGLNGFTYDENDPEFSLFSDEECTTPIATTTVTNAWGFVNENKTATYYIKNTGTGTLNLTKTDAPTGFTATLGAASLTAGAKTSLTIAMANNSATNEGYHAGDVVLTAKDNADNTLGTFTVTSSGVVVSASKTDINFTALSDVPAGWDKGSWSVTANEKVAVGYSSSTMTTGTYTVAAGESMAIKAKKQSNYGTLTYSYSTDNGETWSEAQTITPSSTSYELIAISGIPAGTAKIKFTGTYIDIQRIYGFTAVLEPAMTLSPAAASYDFGMQTAAANYEITVTNSGTAEMTGVTAELAGTDAADYQVVMSIPDGSSATISENVATIPVGQTLKVTATLKASTQYKEHNATLTISADELADKVITLKGKTRDASKLYADFQDDLPATWIADGWSRTYSGTNYFVQANASGTNTLTTPALTVAAGEELKYDAWFGYSAGSITVRYTTNNGITWTEQNVECSTTQTTKTLSLGNASPVTAYIQFVGNSYARIDNFYGGSPAVDVPLISVTKSAAVVESGATEAFGTILAETSAEYTIKNIGNGTLTITSPVTVTGVATATVSETSLANNESATLTITMSVEAPYGDKAGAVTVETNLGNFVVNYTATTKNPNTLNVDFSDNTLPAGWYNDGWNFDTWDKFIYRSNRSSDTYFMTQKLSVAGSSDVLSFDAKKYSTTYASSTVLKVSYSTDRLNWTEIGDYASEMTTSWKTFEISGLAAGEYYLKFEGRYASIDNIIGWEKVAGIDHDLYVTATSFPATTDKGESATISATVTSLRAAETGVYAKLFIDGTEKETAASQDIALNGTKTFSFSYAIPENKTAQIKVYYSNDEEAFVTAENAMKVNYTMSETDAPASFDAGTYNVTLTYTKGAAKLGTICLPFATTTEELSTKYGVTVKIYELTSHADNVISFSGVESLDAGKPYLIYSDEALSGELTFADKAVVATASTTEASGVTFHGIYAPTTAGNWGAEWYGVTSEGKIAKGTSTTTMNGLRAYFTGNVANARIFIVDDENTTGIAAINREGMTIDNAAVYNLSGQKVQHAKKGLYIVNGKKVVIK